MRDLDSLLGASTYLQKLARETSLVLDDQPASIVDQLRSLCHDLERYDFQPVVAAFDQEPQLGRDSQQAAEAFLLQAKTDFAFAWCILELNSLLPQQELGEWQTRFAQTTIHFALRLAWIAVVPKHKVIQPMVAESLGAVPGLFIFGMGKLGGNDLNFSSDVDLVAYFDPAVLAVPDMLGKSYVCHQVLQKLTQLLGQNGPGQTNSANFVWRVDWRLRPNASATSLAMSTDAAEDYYFYRASPWHRLALMKARVVAGDFGLGRQFLDTITPFIWRQNLDYRALDELAEIKQRINLEHPALRAQRQWPEPIGDDIAGLNVKLGSGGIREIEFIANALQLVWGGRIYDLRTPNTVEALTALAKHGQLTLAAAEKLVQSYQVLRRIENAIQILDNQQTHLLPKSGQNQARLLVLLAYQNWQDLVNRINPYRTFVHTTFNDLFAEQVAAQGDTIEWPTELSAKADEVVQNWEDGYQSYGVSIEVRHRLLPLTRGISKYLADDAQASETILRLHEFFGALPSGEQYFRLLAESPQLLDSIVPPLLYSPPMTHLLKQSPHIIDCYVHSNWAYPEPFDYAYVLQADQYERRLERLRRFVNEHLYQLYLSFLQGKLSADNFQAALSDLAEVTLELALKVVAEHMQLSESPITIIGMGKVALRRMSPLSDLDLIFVYDANSVSLETASRFVSRLQTAISTPMREGYVYELDTRLRPSGRSGAPTVSVTSFDSHHRTRAHTWEHIALMPSRVVAGNLNTLNAIKGIKRWVINTPRDQNQLLRDALKMWQRIAEHRVSDVPDSVMRSKLRTGGLMQAEYLAACLILTHQKPFSTDSVEFDDLLSEALIGSELVELPTIIQFWRIQQLWERLLAKTDQPISSLPKPYLSLMLKQSDVSSVSELLSKQYNYAKQVSSALTALFEPLGMSDDDVEQWLERSVDWQY